MAEKWFLKGIDIELCNCDPGCGCNFKGAPNSPEGNCEAFVCHVVQSGRYADVDLAGTTIAWALWWPGAIHEGKGRGHAYIDCATDEQFEALKTIVRGEAGYPYFEIFNSTFIEPSAAERSKVEVSVDGKSSSFSVKGVGEGIMTPLRSLKGDVNEVRIVKSAGFIWKDGEIAQGKRLYVDLPEMKFDLSGRHAVFAPFDWSN